MKAAGVVIDDAAVTPRYLVGLTADRGQGIGMDRTVLRKRLLNRPFNGG